MRVLCNSLPTTPWRQDLEFDSSRLSLFLTRVSSHYADTANLKSLLQPSEVAHGSRYHHPDDRFRFLVARATLRLVLSKYLNQLPSDIMLSGGQNQKPTLLANSKLHFNISHSSDCILIGVFSEALGVDIEEVKTAFTYQDIVQHSFSEAEQAHLEGISADGRDFFYQSWTRKEAFVKAMARGIGSGLRGIPCSDGLHGEPETSAYTLDWVVSSFFVSTDYKAAVAYRPRNKVTSLRFFHLPPDFYQ